jgi:hypothetical protein
MHLAKNFLDIGLSTNNLAPILAFWQEEAGATFDHVLPIRPGHDQHRHDISGSVLKINHHVSPLPPNPPSGYRELIIAREGLTSVKEMADPGRQSRDSCADGAGWRESDCRQNGRA